MLIDGTLPPDLAGVAEEARTAEALGYDGLWVAEVAADLSRGGRTRHDQGGR